MSGKVKRFRGIEFWAENGVIYLCNEKAAEGKDYDKLSLEERAKIFKGLPPKVFYKRAIMAGLHAERAATTERQLREVYQFLQDAREIFKLANEQGAVDSAEADRYKLEHKVYRKPQIIVPGFNDNPKPEEILLEGRGVDDG